jgi:hypothetical protein
METAAVQAVQPVIRAPIRWNRWSGSPRPFENSVL